MYIFKIVALNFRENHKLKLENIFSNTSINNNLKFMKEIKLLDLSLNRNIDDINL